jgi:hypothetical protein
MFKRICMVLALAWPTLAQAQTGGGLASCEDAGVGLTSLAVGEHEGVRTFYQGQVVLLALNTEEPAAAPAGIAVLMPDPPVGNEPPSTGCWAIIGYGRVDVDRARARYDPASGLTLTIPTMVYDADHDRDVAAPPIRLRINATRGTIVDQNAGR